MSATNPPHSISSQELSLVRHFSFYGSSLFKCGANDGATSSMLLCHYEIDDMIASLSQIRSNATFYCQVNIQLCGYFHVPVTARGQHQSVGEAFKGLEQFTQLLCRAHFFTPGKFTLFDGTFDFQSFRHVLRMILTHVSGSHCYV